MLCDVSRGAAGSWHVCEFEAKESLCGRKVTEMIPPIDPLAYENDRRKLLDLASCETCLEKTKACLPRTDGSNGSLASARIALSGRVAMAESKESAHTVQLSLEN